MWNVDHGLLVWATSFEMEWVILLVFQRMETKDSFKYNQSSTLDLFNLLFSEIFQYNLLPSAHFLLPLLLLLLGRSVIWNFHSYYCEMGARRGTFSTRIFNSTDLVIQNMYEAILDHDYLLERINFSNHFFGSKVMIFWEIGHPIDEMIKYEFNYFW